MKTQKFRYAAWGVLVWNLAVVAWGAFVRASFSGDGCGTHWPTCHGDVVPLGAETKTLIEFSHRATSGLALLCIVALAVWAFRVFPRGHWVRRGAIYSAIFVFSEALVGAGLVLFELVTHNESAYRALALSLHLMNTFVLLAFLFATAWAAGDRFAQHSPRVNWRGQGILGKWLAIAIALMLLAGVWGSIAALGDMLFPSATLAEGLKADFSPLSSLWVRLRWVHPVVAIGAGIYLIWCALAVRQRLPHWEVENAGQAVIALVIGQTAIGVVNWLMMAPVFMQIVHLLVADSLWLAVIWLVLESLHANAGAANQVEWYQSPSGQGEESMQRALK